MLKAGANIKTMFQKGITTILVVIIITMQFSGAIESYAKASPIDLDEVLTEMDAKLNFGHNTGSISSELTIIHKDTDGTEETRTAVMYRKNGRDKFMIVTTSPITDFGSGYLKVDSNVFYYDASNRKWIRKTDREKYFKSDVESKDLEENKYKPHFDWEYEGEGKVGKIDCYILKGTAKFEDMPYPTQRVWIKKSDYLPLKEVSYTASGVASRTTYMLHYTKLYSEEKGRYTYIDDKRLIVDNIDKTQTIRQLTNISLQKLPENMFSKAEFEKYVTKNR